MVKFSDIFEFQRKSGTKAGEGLTAGKYPFYTSSCEQSKYLNNFRFQGDSLILGTGGDASVHFNNGKFSVSTDCLVAQPKSSPMRMVKYYYYFLKGNIHILKKGFRGAGLKHISKGYLSQVDLPDADYQSQKQVVNILDCVETLRQKRKQSFQLFDDFLRATFIDMFGDPIINPKKWTVKKFVDAGTLDRGISKTRPRNAPQLLGGPYPLIQTGDVANSEGYIRTYNQTYSEIGLRQSKMWPVGTLCITIAANIAKTGILTFEACFPDSVVGFIPNKTVRIEYVQLWLSFLQKSLEDKAPESAQKNINLAILRNIDIPIAPIELQNKFATIVAKVTKTKHKAQQSLLEMDGQFDSLVQKLFGEIKNV